MSELMVAGFKGTHRAAEVLDQLTEIGYSSGINLKDAVAVYRTKGGKLRVDSSVQPTSKEGAAWGGLVGTMLGGLLLAPLTAGASTAAAAAAIGSGALAFGTVGAVIGGEDTAEDKAKYGISEEFVKQVGGMVQPEQSAIFVLADTKHPESVAEKFRGYGATILRTTLRPEVAKRMQQVISADGAPAY